MDNKESFPKEKIQWLKKLSHTFIRWFDSDSVGGNSSTVRVIQYLPFILIHLACFAVFWVGFSPIALGVFIFLYAFRVFSLTAFYHRYFSHRTFKTNRFWQFIFALCGATAIQRGALWWASHHRHHHLHADTEEDIHTPKFGFWYSHLWWFSESKNYRTNYQRIPDFACYPELVFLNRFDTLVPILLFLGLYFLGDFWGQTNPDVSGWQLVVWGGCLSTVAVYHATFCVNSLCHLFGKKRYHEDNDSRNNWFVALITFGEGWHNNHHHYPASARQGFYWWEIDITYYILCILSWVGIVSDLKSVPKSYLEKGLATK